MRRAFPLPLLVGAGVGASLGLFAWLATRRAAAKAPTTTKPIEETLEDFPPPPPRLEPGERPKPDGVVRQMTIPERDELLTRFEFVPEPTKAKPDGIRITDDWVEKHIVKVCIPQLVGIPGAPKDGCVQAHRLVAPRLKRLFRAWELAGVLPLVLSWTELWDLRYARGGVKPIKPSTHAYAAAFDINADLNPQGNPGPGPGQRGSTWDLVRIAAREGFYWGGWFPYKDDMHFEYGILMDPTKVS